MHTENPSYHHNYSHLEYLLRNHYDAQEIADRLRAMRLVLAEQMAREDQAGDYIDCYRMLYELEEVFRKLSKA